MCNVVDGFGLKASFFLHYGANSLDALVTGTCYSNGEFRRLIFHRRISLPLSTYWTAILINIWVGIPLGAWLSLVNGVRWKSLSRADHSSRGVLPSVVCQCDREAWTSRRPLPLGAVAP